MRVGARCPATLSSFAGFAGYGAWVHQKMGVCRPLHRVPRSHGLPVLCAGTHQVCRGVAKWVRGIGPCRERRQIGKRRRDEPGTLYQAFLDQLSQSGQIGKRGLAAKQQRHLRDATLPHGPTNVLGNQPESLAVTNVLGEWATAGGQTAAKDANRVLITLACLVPSAAKEVEDFQEIGPFLGQSHSLDAVAQSSQSLREGRRGQD